MSEPPSSILPFSPSTSPAPANREYRKGNWTLQETLTIITAKKLDDDRRASSSSSSKHGELRWKWVENYCWAHGCFRSQNQCNDKWDNLLRDYKKIRDYQSKSNNNAASAAASSSDSFPSYWNMDRQQRKYYNLPSNMSFEVFQALDEVIQRKFRTSVQQQQQQPPQQQLLPPPPPVTTTPERISVPEMRGGSDAPAVSEEQEEGAESSSATESSESSRSKRRKVKKIGESIKRSASKIAETIRKCEEKKEKRHQQLMEYEQKRLQLEHTRNEVHSQAFSSLLMAVTNLSSAIQSLASPHKS